MQAPAVALPAAHPTAPATRFLPATPFARADQFFLPQSPPPPTPVGTRRSVRAGAWSDAEAAYDACSGSKARQTPKGVGERRPVPRTRRNPARQGWWRRRATYRRGGGAPPPPRAATGVPWTRTLHARRRGRWAVRPAQVCSHCPSLASSSPPSTFPPRFQKKKNKTSHPPFPSFPPPQGPRRVQAAQGRRWCGDGEGGEGEGGGAGSGGVEQRPGGSLRAWRGGPPRPAPPPSLVAAAGAPRRRAAPAATARRAGQTRDPSRR